MNETLKYYNSNAEQFIKSSLSADMSGIQNEFLSYLPSKSLILDFGCGAGRDTKYFSERGFHVYAVDGSEEMCRATNEYAKTEVKQMMFNELSESEVYNGIWACSSILHVDKSALVDIFQRMIQALKVGGILYCSFKYGNFEGMRNGRYFTDFDEKSFGKFIFQFSNLKVEKISITNDSRPDRKKDKWLNVFLRKI